MNGRKDKNLSNIHQLNDILRPHEVALVDAINKSIEDIAIGKMTMIEILGCLDFISKDIHLDFYMEKLED